MRTSKTLLVTTGFLFAQFIFSQNIPQLTEKDSIVKSTWIFGLGFNAVDDAGSEFLDVFNFKDNWNEERNDIIAMYESSLKSQYSGFLWGGRRNSPRSAMIEMMEHNADFIRDMFRDLFNEKREVLLRMDRFAFHCDHQYCMFLLQLPL